MSELKISVHDLASGEVFERDMTVSEIAAYKAKQIALQKAEEERLAAEKERERRKTEILQTLGLTIDDLKVLGIG